MIIDESKERRIAVKIRFSPAGKDMGCAEVYYFKSDMTLNFYMRWKWYFDYRAALLRVNNPKAYIDYHTGPYDYILPEDEYKTKLRNLIIAAKSKKTEYSRKIEHVKRNWNQLFPIEDDPKWYKVMEKQKYYEDRLQELLDEQNKLTQ